MPAPKLPVLRVVVLMCNSDSPITNAPIAGLLKLIALPRLMVELRMVALASALLPGKPPPGSLLVNCKPEPIPWVRSIRTPSATMLPPPNELSAAKVVVAGNPGCWVMTTPGVNVRSLFAATRLANDWGAI
ncbi:hypothetical protein D3C81_1024630 [compost metagenome]